MRAAKKRIRRVLAWYGEAEAPQREIAHFAQISRSTLNNVIGGNYKNSHLIATVDRLEAGARRYVDWKIGKLLKLRGKML